MLLYLFGIGGFGRFVARRFPRVQRRFAVNSAAQRPTCHGGRFAGAVTQLVEASLQPAVATTVVLWCIYHGKHERLPSLSLETTKILTFIYLADAWIQTELTNESIIFIISIIEETLNIR